MTLSPQLENKIKSLIASEPVVVFMKGSRYQPQCGFSATVTQILNALIPHYGTVNVLEDPDLREGIKAYSDWPTIPQIYVRGEFIGGCDILKDLFAKGELFKVLNVSLPPLQTPTLHISPKALDALREALQNGDEGEKLRIGIYANFQHELAYGPAQPADIMVEKEGVSLYFDPLSARRANGLKIDFIAGPEGSGFQLDNPNAPPPVQQLSVKDLKNKLDKGETFYFFDVRTKEENEKASIKGAKLLSEISPAELNQIPKNAPIVFHCRSGGRSQRKADEFREKGYTNLYNVTGGIQAWSTEIDPSVPQY